MTPIENLWQRGYGRLGKLLSRKEAEQIRSLYEDPGTFRSRIDMARYRFGRGEYQYFTYPLPSLVEKLRQQLYGSLAGTAAEWMKALNLPQEYPAKLPEFLKRCHDAGQIRPTPLL